jgi:hypothetical protein
MGINWSIDIQQFFPLGFFKPQLKLHLEILFSCFFSNEDGVINQKKPWIYCPLPHQLLHNTRCGFPIHPLFTISDHPLYIISVHPLLTT